MSEEVNAQSVARLELAFRDRWWRLSHLYRIVDEQGFDILFVPNAVQRYLLETMHNRNDVLKSRQHGFTTLASILSLDTALFRSNTACGMVMHKREDAEKVFQRKILYAYDRLPDWLKRLRSVVRRDNTGEIEFSNGSTITVSLSHRGGTLQFLHVSEYGPMCAFFPQRAGEVKSGALNAVSPDGIVTVESTAYGRSGDFYEMTQRAMRLDRMVKAGTAALTKMDYKFHFFAWFQDPKNQLDHAGVAIAPALADYFQMLADKHGIHLSPSQRAWYSKKSEEQGEKMKREHPSTPEEAFEQSIEGAYYGKEMARAEADGRICALPIIPGVRVNLFFDIGMSDSTALWFHQQVGPWHHFVDFYENSGEQVDHYLRVLQDRGYVYGKLFLPHDAANTEWAGTGNKTRVQIIQEKFPGQVELVPRIENLQDGIDMVRQALPLCRFDRNRCGENPPGSARGGLPALQNYRHAWNEQLSVWHDYPLHDWSSNGADAFRQFAQGYPMAGINDEITRARRRGANPRNWKTV